MSAVVNLTPPTRRPIHREHRLPDLMDANKRGKVMAMIKGQWVEVNWSTVQLTDGIIYWMPGRLQ